MKYLDMFAKLSFSSRITDLGSVALTGPILLCMCRSFILEKYFQFGVYIVVK